MLTFLPLRNKYIRKIPSRQPTRWAPALFKTPKILPQATTTSRSGTLQQRTSKTFTPLFQDTVKKDFVKISIINLTSSFYKAHGNEWCAREPTKKVIFCFNKHSGYGGYDRPGWGHGVRNLLFKTTDPKAAIESWIRFENGETRARVVLDENYDSQH